MSCLAGDRQSAIAPAKINLTLRVLGKRADGYHDLESVVAKVTLYDGIDLFVRDGPAIQIECTNPAVPTDAGNTVWRAIEFMAARGSPAPSLRVQLHKRIPVGAGLGGGSSDAAAVLEMLNRYWGGRLERVEIKKLGAQIGSDVPGFLQPGAVYVTGRGETVEPVVLPWAGWVVLVFPPFAVSTAAAYRAWQEGRSCAGPDARACLQPQYNVAEKLDEVLFNDLEQSVFAVEPRLKQTKDLVEEKTGQKLHMTGSGSTLFACLDSHEEAEQLNRRIDQLPGLRSQVTRVIACDDNK